MADLRATTLRFRDRGLCLSYDQGRAKEAPAVLLRVSRPAAVLAALLICGAGVVLGAAPAGAAPAISVSPSTGLHNGQTVTVSGSGFTKNGTVYIVECKAGATSEGQCSFDFSDLSTVVVAKADASGNLRTPSPTLKTSFKSTDCTKVACEIAAHQTLSLSLTAANTAVHSISFGAASHPTTAHSAPASTAHSTAAGASTSAQTSTSASASASNSASSSAAASSGGAATSAASSDTSSTAPAPQAGTSSHSGSSSPVASVVKKKADNGGRYAVVAIVAVLAVLFVGAMALSGRRAGGG
jgi:hypothetical protein